MNADETIGYIDKMQKAKAIDPDEPLLVIHASQFLFPQYDVFKLVEQFRLEDETKKWLVKTATNNLAGDHGVWEVRHHWVKIIRDALDEEEAKRT